MDMKACGEFIRQCRAKRELSQQQLARQLHITRETVSKWENGRGFPDVSLLQPLAESLGVTVSELLCSGRGAQDEEALYNWIYLTERERELQRKHSVWLLLAVAGVITAHFLVGGALTPLLCLLAPGLPLALALNGRFSLGSIVSSSFGCCLAVMVSELLRLRERAAEGDWSGIGDTIGVTVAICVVVASVTMLMNALLFSARKK